MPAVSDNVDRDLVAERSTDLHSVGHLPPRVAEPNEVRQVVNVPRFLRSLLSSKESLPQVLGLLLPNHYLVNLN